MVTVLHVEIENGGADALEWITAVGTVVAIAIALLLAVWGDRLKRSHLVVLALPALPRIRAGVVYNNGAKAVTILEIWATDGEGHAQPGRGYYDHEAQKDPLLPGASLRFSIDMHLEEGLQPPVYFAVLDVTRRVHWGWADPQRHRKRVWPRPWRKLRGTGY